MLSSSSLFRPLGTYLLAGSAFYSQLQTNHHLTQMTELAAASIAVSLSADTQLESSFALQQQAATNAEKGLQLQSESVEHESIAAKMEMEAASEMAISEEYTAEAETLYQHSAIEASESTAYLSTAEELQLQSNALRLEAESNLAASAINEAKSLADIEESVKAGEVATAAEEKGAEYEVVALRKEGQSVKDGEALLKTETGAMEDVEAMAACAPIPGLNIVCEAVGSIVEVGYQSIAAVEGAKAAVETIQGVTAAQRGRAEMILAARGHEEEARLALEAEQLQIKADEEGANASSEQAESEAMIAEAKESEIMSNEKAHQSQEDEAMATVDEELAAKHEAKAARDETIAAEEESSAVASQIKSDELLTESTSEEFEAIADRTAAESEASEAQKMLEESIDHGMHSLVFAIRAIITAGMVVYILVMRGLSKVVVPGLTKIWMNNRNDPSSVPIREQLCDALMHAGIIVGAIVSMATLLSNFDDLATFPKARALMVLAVVAGCTEALGIHATNTMINCHMRGMSMGSTLAEATRTFSSNVIHLIPAVLMEILMLVVMFGQEFFNMVYRYVQLNPVWCWIILLLFGMVPTLLLKLQKHIKSESESSLAENAGECGTLLDSSTSSENRRQDIADINLEYGSMEDVCLLPSSDQQNHVGNTTAKISSCGIKECYKVVRDYFANLRRWSDLLVLTIMIMLLWRSRPVLTLLHPLLATFEGMITSWVPLPVVIISALAVAIIFHIIFVR